jgi:hypothetical protein
MRTMVALKRCLIFYFILFRQGSFRADYGCVFMEMDEVLSFYTQEAPTDSQRPYIIPSKLVPCRREDSKGQALDESVLQGG